MHENTEVLFSEGEAVGVGGKIVVELNIVFPNVVVRIELLQLEIHDADFFHDLQGFRGKGKGQGAARKLIVMIKINPIVGKQGRTGCRLAGSHLTEDIPAVGSGDVDKRIVGSLRAHLRNRHNGEQAGHGQGQTQQSFDFGCSFHCFTPIFFSNHWSDSSDYIRIRQRIQFYVIFK